MIFQPCEPKDIEACAKLLSVVYSEEPYNEAWTIADAIAYLERFRGIDPDGCFVAKANDEVAGAIFSFSYPWHGGKLVCIQELFVSPNHRRKGIARQLVSSLNQEEEVYTWLVSHEKSDASGFYQAMGLSQKGPYKFWNGIINAQL
jgi:GNAT superfamily N-acetyltransferase